MAYSDSEVLAGVLAVSCLILLYCWNNKRSCEGLMGTSKKHLPGLHGLQSGFESNSGAYSSGSGHVYIPMHKTQLQDSVTKLSKRSGLVGDDSPVAGMNELITDHTPSPSNMKGIPNNMVDMRWAPDYGLNVNNQSATVKDYILGNANNRSDTTDPSIYRMFKTEKANNSLSGDILGLTDYGKDYDFAEQMYSATANTSGSITT